MTTIADEDHGASSVIDMTEPSDDAEHERANEMIAESSLPPTNPNVKRSALVIVKSEPSSKRPKTSHAGEVNGVVGACAATDEAESSLLVAAMPDPCDSRGNSVGDKNPLRTFNNGETNNDNDDDDVMVVEAPAKILVPIHMAAGGWKTTGDDELQMMGYANPVLLPHLRPYCSEQLTAFCPLSGFTFTNEARTIPPWAMMGYDTNADICNLCYCYVCDKPAKDCQVCVIDTQV
jgi:hypothetical protein